jgi:hypothetical protein
MPMPIEVSRKTPCRRYASATTGTTGVAARNSGRRGVISVTASGASSATARASAVKPANAYVAVRASTRGAPGSRTRE